MIKILLYDLLAKRRMSQRELSRLTGIRANTISDMCSEICEHVSLTNLEKICVALELKDLSQLIRREPDAPEDEDQ